MATVVTRDSDYGVFSVLMMTANDDGDDDNSVNDNVGSCFFSFEGRTETMSACVCMCVFCLSSVCLCVSVPRKRFIRNC